MSEVWIAIGVNLALGALLATLLLCLNRRDEAYLTGELEARRLFADHYSVVVSSVLVCDAGRSALLSLERGLYMGLIDRHARRWTIRLFGAAELRRVDLDEAGAIHIRFIDFGWPSARLMVSDASLRSDWYWQLKHLGGAEGTRHRAYAGDATHA